MGMEYTDNPPSSTGDRLYELLTHEEIDRIGYLSGDDVFLAGDEWALLQKLIESECDTGNIPAALDPYSGERTIITNVLARISVLRRKGIVTFKDQIERERETGFPMCEVLELTIERQGLRPTCVLNTLRKREESEKGDG